MQDPLYEQGIYCMDNFNAKFKVAILEQRKDCEAPPIEGWKAPQIENLMPS